MEDSEVEIGLEEVEEMLLNMRKNSSLEVEESHTDNK